MVSNANRVKKELETIYSTSANSSLHQPNLIETTSRSFACFKINGFKGIERIVETTIPTSKD